jgi:CheY-like chemotaxis protein
MKILVLDDEKTVSRAISFGLQKKGHLVEEIQNPLDALTKIEQENFDFLVLDFNLSPLSGPDLLKLIHNNNTSIPGIIITSNDIEAIKKSEFPFGIEYKVISKDNSIIDIVNEIESSIASKRTSN